MSLDQISQPLSRKQALRAKGLQPNPFGQAIDEFLADLVKRKDKAKNPFLEEITSLESRIVQNSDGHGTSQAEISSNNLRQFMERLASQRRARPGYRILSRLRPFIDNLQMVMETCANLTQASPFAVSVAFSGAQIVLRLASGTASYFDTLVDAMEQINVFLPCYKSFADAYQDTQVQQQLVISYKRIIEFWFRVTGILSQKTLKTTFKSILKPLDQEIKTALGGLNQDMMNVQAIAQATEALQTARGRDEKLRSGIVSWIKSDQHIDVRIDVQGHLDRRQEGTCTWLFGDTRFKNWRSSRENAILWYNGDPGSGKSVLSSVVVDHLMGTGDKVAYFFYAFNDPLRRHGINGMRSLALQLLTILDKTPVPDRLTGLYEDEMKHHATALNEPDKAKKVVHTLLNICDDVHVVIDGLDECADEKVMLRILELLISERTLGCVKWLFTSRNHPKIRSLMEKFKAVEISPDLGAVSRDIQTYFSAKLPSVDKKSIARQITDSDSNFLYARLICETLRCEGYVCDEEIEEALNKLPKDLTSYYIQLLERLTTRTEEEQKLARNVFLILVAAEQSISINELLNALAIRSEAKDHSDSRVPLESRVEELCVPFLTFNRSGKESDNNTVVKFCHKSMKDFFLPEPKSINIPEHLRKYFATPAMASEELAKCCLTYLQYQRYTRPLPIKLLLEENRKEHAFLRYAATFWFQHLGRVEPSPEIDKRVKDFLQNKAFWTCLSVQSHTVKYLFACFTGTGTGLYAMDMKGSERRDTDSFGLPLPDWLESYSTSGRLLDQSLCCFVDEWREVLIACPEGLDSCVPLRRFPENCHLKSLTETKRVRVAHLAEAFVMDTVMDVRLGDMSFSQKTVCTDVFYRNKDGAENEVQRLRIPLFTKRKDSISSSHFLPTGTNWLISASRRNQLTETVEACSIDPETLTVRRTTQYHSEKHEIPSVLRPSIIGKKKGKWEFLSTETKYDDQGDIRAQIIHMRWRANKVTKDDDYTGEKEETLGGSDLSNAESSEEDYSDDDSDLSAAESNEEDYSDDSSLNDGFVPENPHSDTDNSNESVEAEYNFGDEKNVTDCLIIIPRNGPPFWHTWSSPSKTWASVNYSMHPTLALLAFTHTGRQLEIIDIVAGNRRTCHLPEPIGPQETPLLGVRELRFSSSSNYIYFLSAAFVDENEKSTCHVTVSTFSFNDEGDCDDTLLRECEPRCCKYSFGDPLNDIPRPIALTSWTDDFVIIALPPLTCDPKILMVILPKIPATTELATNCESKDAVLTLREPIYFPTSTPRRNPRLLYRPGEADKDGYVYLSLDAEMPKSDAVTRHDQPSLTRPPVVLRWKVAKEDGWRTWDRENDEKSTTLKSEESIWNILRGTFVEHEKAFNVPIRSGLNWTRKGYLSCG